MRNAFYTLVFQYFILFPVYAQQPIVDMGNNGSVTTIRFNNMKANEYNVLRGSPYLSERFEKASFQLNNGQWTKDQMEIRLNTYSQQIEYQKDGTIMSSSLNNIRAFRIGDVLFKSGFENIDKQTTGSFYQVLYEYKTALIKYAVTEMKTVKNFDDTKQGDEFVTYQYYYLVDTNKRLTKITLSKKNILKALPESKLGVVEAFIKEKNMKFKTWDEVIELVKELDK